MCFGSSPKPPPAPVATPPPPIEQPIDEAGIQSRDAQRRRMRAMAGYASTSLAGGAGSTSQANIGKTSLGA